MAIIGDPIPKYVKNQIIIRQNTHGAGINQNRPELTLATTNLPTSWIKLASGVSVSSAKLKTLGYNEGDISQLKGKGLAKNHVLFSGLSQKLELFKGFSNQFTPEKLIQKEDFIGDNGTYIPDKEWGIIPMPGIISADIKSLNRGSLKKATVKFIAQSRNQLTVLDILYLRLGYTVLLEWGNSFYKTYQSVTNDPNTPTDERFTTEQMGPTLIESNSKFFNDGWAKNTHRQILPEIESLREKHQGNYDALLGKVSNFNWSFNNDGSYDVELTIISLGDVVESLKSNVIAATDTLNYVNNNPIQYTSESSTLDQHRKDNIILSLLHVLKLINLQTQDPTKITVKTKQKNPPADQPIANPGNLLQGGSAILTSSDWTLKIVGKVYIQSDNFQNRLAILPESGVFLPGLWFSNTIKQYSDTRPRSNPNWKQGFGWFPSSNGIDALVYSNNPSVLELKEKKTSIDIIVEKVFSEADHLLYSATPSTGPIRELIDKFNLDYNAATNDQNWSFTDPSDSTKSYKIADLFLFPTKATNLPPIPSQGAEYFNRQLSIANITPTFTLTPSNTVNIPNPINNTGYNIKDAFVLKLDIPQYYIRFGFLLDLVEQKVITRIDQGKSKHDDNQNLFNIDYKKAPMLCLPEQISFDWRKCIVSREKFDRASWSYNQNIFPELKEWQLGSSQVANAMNVYLNFEFIAESLTSNLDEKGNISVYNFIKSLCDGINIALGGVNNLEPIIDENTNILEILDSSPSNNQPKEATDYELKLYGYSKQNYFGDSRDASTFVRKVDLKTAITPEYATMVTVGATAGGYVKGVEATAFARWNDGILDRFKEKLIAADKDVAKINTSGNENEDTIASFERAMAFTSACFGIEGNGSLWETFP